MWKKVLCMLLAIGIMAPAFPKMTLGADGGIRSDAKAYVLIDSESGNMILGQNEQEPLACDSLVKSMSLLIVLEALERGEISLSDKVNISKEAASKGGTQVFLDAGQTYDVNSLLKACLVCSANDAMTALAEHVAGSEAAFVQKMNARAQELGLSSSTFTNCTGLKDEAQKASALDIAKISAQIVKYQICLKYSSIWMDTFVHNDGRETEMINSNKLVKQVKGTDGLMTGSSAEGGYSVIATKKGMSGRFICVVIGAKNSSSRFQTCIDALNYAEANYLSKRIVAQGELVKKNVPIADGRVKELNVYAKDDFSTLIPKEQANSVEKQIVLSEEIQAPLKKGDEVGSILITLDGKEIGKVPIIVNEDVEENTFQHCMKRVLYSWLFE